MIVYEWSLIINNYNGIKKQNDQCFNEAIILFSHIVAWFLWARWSISHILRANFAPTAPFNPSLFTSCLIKLKGCDVRCWTDDPGLTYANKFIIFNSRSWSYVSELDDIFLIAGIYCLNIYLPFCCWLRAMVS